MDGLCGWMQLAKLIPLGETGTVTSGTPAETCQIRELFTGSSGLCRRCLLNPRHSKVDVAYLKRQTCVPHFRG